LAVLRLSVEHVWVKRIPKIRRKRLVLAKVVALEEVVEVGVVRVRNIKWVGRNVVVVALGAKLRRIMLRDRLSSLEEAWVGKAVLLRELLSLGRGKELGAVQPRACDCVRGWVLNRIEAQADVMLVLERRMWARRGRVRLMNALAY
jgi:hypothetical protein